MQENIYITIPISNNLSDDMIKSNGFILEFSFDYYSINDKNKETRFYYYSEYGFEIDKIYIINQTRDITFKYPVLIKIDAE